MQPSINDGTLIQTGIGLLSSAFPARVMQDLVDSVVCMGVLQRCGNECIVPV